MRGRARRSVQDTWKRIPRPEWRPPSGRSPNALRAMVARGASLSHPEVFFMSLHRFAASAIAVASLVLLARDAAADPVKLKVGTAAAPDSPWGQVFKTWRKAVETKTSNAVSFDFYFNSTQGTE